MRFQNAIIRAMSEIFTFGQRYREAKLKSFRLHDTRVPQLVEEYKRLPQRREAFAIFCREEGFSAITTQEQYDQKKSEMTAKVAARG